MKKGQNCAFGAVVSANEFSLVAHFTGIINLGLEGAKQLASVQKVLLAES